MRFRDLITEGTSISIGQLNTIDGSLYVLICGGVGAGKSYVLSKNTDLPIIDIDDVTMELGNGEYNPKNTSKAMAITNKKVKSKIESGESFIHMGTSANLNSTINKLTYAKSNGYTTVLLFIDTPPEQAYANNQERVGAGGRGNEIPEHKFQRTYDSAKNTFDKLKDDELTDYVIHYDNRR
jgi:predicted kinase